MSAPLAPPPNPKSPAPDDRVPLGQKIAYGIGGLPSFFGTVGVKSLAIPVYQMTLRMDPALLGLLMAIPRLWDAFTDPIMGYVSDRTRSRFGRRRPYILVGAILTAFSFAAIWMVPTTWGSSGQSVWFLISSLLFFTCFTVWSVPYTSLGLEITPNYHERTDVMGMKMFFNKCGEFVYQWIFPLAQLAIFASIMQGIQVVTIGIAVVVFLGFGVLPGLFVRERFVGARPPTSAVVPLVKIVRPTFWSSYLSLLQSRAILILVALNILRLLNSVFTSSLDYYLLVYLISDGDVQQGSIWKGVLSTGFAIVGIAAIAPVAWCCRRFDKTHTLWGIYVLSIIGGVAKWFIYAPGHSPWWILLDPLLNGATLIALGMVVPSMLADVCDHDEWQHGERREGMIGAFMTWVQKTGSSLAFLFAGISLNWIGFDAALGGGQSPETFLGMKFFLTGSTVLMSVCSIAALYFYPLSEAKLKDTRTDLEARRGAV